MQFESKKVIENLKSSADFCPECGNIIDLPIYSDYVQCSRCNLKCDITEFKTEVIISQKEYRDKKLWVELFNRRVKKEETQVEKEYKKMKKASQGRTTIQQECPACHHPEMYFFNLQLRSADEGTTVFYECVKCGYKSSQNN